MDGLYWETWYNNGDNLEMPCTKERLGMKGTYKQTRVFINVNKRNLPYSLWIRRDTARTKAWANSNQIKSGMCDNNNIVLFPKSNVMTCDNHVDLLVNKTWLHFCLHFFAGPCPIDIRDRLIMYSNRMLGVPRLRQLRVRNDSCSIPEDFVGAIQVSLSC